MHTKYTDTTEHAKDVVKHRIRETGFVPHVSKSERTDTDIIGYHHDLSLHPLGSEELTELLTTGTGYPDTSNINKNFAEYLLIRDINIATDTVTRIFKKRNRHASLGRQIVLIEIMFYLGKDEFRKLKKFISAVNHHEWETAIHEIDNDIISDLIEEYAKLFRND